MYLIIIKSKKSICIKVRKSFIGAVKTSVKWLLENEKITLEQTVEALNILKERSSFESLISINEASEDVIINI